MSKINDGGPAFPLSTDDPNLAASRGVAGMTLHQYYVGQVLTGLFTGLKTFDELAAGGVVPLVESRVILAIMVANAAIAALDKTPDAMIEAAGDSRSQAALIAVLVETCKTVRASLELHQHWKPEMPINLVAQLTHAIDQAVPTA